MDVVLRNFLPLSLFFCLSCLCQTNGYLWGRENSNKQLETLVNRWDNKKYRDCGEVRKYGEYTKDGVYRIWMNSTYSFEIYCIHNVNNSYNVILRRMDPQISFSQGWQSYVSGFGNSQSDYWIGLNQIYYLTNIQRNTILTINLQDWAGNNKNARYSHFQLIDSTSYTLRIGGYSGDAGDSMSHNDNMAFATQDKPDRNYCAVHQQGGWWFNYCTYAFLTGKYYYGGPYTPSGSYFDGIYWYSWGGYSYSMKFAQMMVSNN